ncbi:assimilatory sulfite reductase (NADPH) hemoprotein subunit [Candidatus Purcelliella pentastirinorum]|uniref:assimilatory sulfite reductase (NADPH) hemoprotein subunit n=1 Tax=Candidatus Purcelliella pentastirinorum TaxID=472834 RepID=UPI002368C240|nr:assimilatory sulfite reductase (NADPH) hemoprotein subunit [Candidatus Purcelliella pentastirinorum]WDI79006.1 assimilatory sulfite reductase (NADPH) hemoprotein subunit [Candidatus Purcelliella pentastirinorum]WDR80143.1 assimilatory sulfite reductase (NADPH) hemoprotein subunit [Candidatus Purcelliella pentastirinorum]
MLYKINKKFIVKGKLTNEEKIKKKSNFLRGTIAKDINNEITGGFSNHNYSLIRFHGMYQQDNRDIRLERLKQKLEPKYSMMLRCRLPGGIISTKQWLSIDDFANRNTLYGSIRLTNRQTFQFHGILKYKLKSIHKILNKLGLDSLATANDVNRNVLCTSNPMESNIHMEVYQIAKRISEHLLPKTNAYSEIWLDKEKIGTTEVEPILGNTYLPRKFKTTIVIPPYNDVDIHANDMNFIAIIYKERLIGFNLLIGGGLSIVYDNYSTWPSIAKEVGFLKTNDILRVAEAVITIQRDWGNRTNRQNAKTKYTLERVGLNNFKKEIEYRSGIKFDPIYPYKFIKRGDRFGWLKGIDNKWNLTLFIEQGRLIDKLNSPIKRGVAEIAKIHNGYFRLTANQNLIISSVQENNKLIIENIALKYGLLNFVTKQRKNSMACVSYPTCPLAMSEGERELSYFINRIEKILSKYGLENEYIIFRISGCSNGCARSLLAEIGLLGKSIDYYNMYIGGNRIGTRIPRIYLKNIYKKQIIFHIDDLINRWANERLYKENFGDFVIRVNIIKPVLNSPKDFW